MKKSSSDEIGKKKEVSLRTEIIRRPTTTKTNREFDNRIQWAAKMSMFITGAIFLSVAGNVYQSITHGGYVFYAQDIRTGMLTAPLAIPPDQIKPGTKVGPAPAFTEAIIARIDKATSEREKWLDSLNRPEILAARIAQLDTFTGAGAVPQSALPMPGGPGALPYLSVPTLSMNEVPPPSLPVLPQGNVAAR